MTMTLFELLDQFEREAGTLEESGRAIEARRARADAERIRAWARGAVMQCIEPGREDRDFVRHLLADSLITAVGEKHAEEIAQRFARIASPLKQSGVDQLNAASAIRKAILLRKEPESVPV